jgi:NhaA family Na+:H+ antiporter
MYGDYLCHYCRGLQAVLERLRRALGEREVYVFRHSPNERAHPGAELMSVGAEAAGLQGRFWEMHDALYAHELPLDKSVLLEIAASLGLDMDRFDRDLADERLRRRVEEDLADGRRNGVTATPTIFVDGVRYDGAWDFYSMLEAVERPVGAQVRRTARAFANLPSSAALVLLAATLAALIWANSPIASGYESFVNTPLRIGSPHAALTLSVAGWCSEGLLALFFVILGLEIRREVTAGSLTDLHAAFAPILAAIGGLVAPAGVYLALNTTTTARGWLVPTDTSIATTLGILALLGLRASAGLKVFVATYAVADEVLAVLLMALIFPQAIQPKWFLMGVFAVTAMAVFNRWRVYATWPYLAATFGLWISLHFAGVSAAVSGIAFAAFLPRRPAPAAEPLLAQAATALAELEHAEQGMKCAGDSRHRLEEEPVWDWASRNLSAAAERLLSPAERVEQCAAPWSTYIALPLFAFTAAGVSLAGDFAAPHAATVFFGAALGLAIGKPIGVGLTTWASVKAKIAVLPVDVTPVALLGAAFLCGIGDPLSLLAADRAFPGSAYAGVAKIGVWAGSVVAALLGVLTLLLSAPPVAQARRADRQAPTPPSSNAGLGEN